MTNAFVQLLDRVISVADTKAAAALSAKAEAWRIDAYETVARNFKAIRERAIADDFLAHPRARLGATRALSEWGLDEDELYRAVKAAEDYYAAGGN